MGSSSGLVNGYILGIYYLLTIPGSWHKMGVFGLAEGTFYGGPPRMNEKSTRTVNESLREEVEGLSGIQHDLGERVKELNCLYGLSELVEREGIALPEIYEGLVTLIRPAWQYPEETCARLTVDGSTYITDRFRATYWRQAANIWTGKQKEGVLEVFYLKEKPQLDEGPFLEEERKLIDCLAERLGKIIQRYRVEAALKQSREVLQLQKSALERKNAALQEVLSQVELEKKKIETNVKINVDTILAPILAKMRARREITPFVDLIASYLNELTSSFGIAISTNLSALSPREIDVCTMVKSGMTSKEIAASLGISSQTVEKHRSTIRRKLGIMGEKRNLVSFLRSLDRGTTDS